MSHLRLIGNEPKKPPRRKGDLYFKHLLSREEQKRAAQALRNLKNAFGSWPCLSDAMGVRKNTIQRAIRAGEVSIALLFAASRASGLTIDDLLSAPVPTDRCRACGQVKRYAKALEARAV